MSETEAVEALRKLNLSNYEAQVFVALQQLGTGSAQEISRVSDVPRSHVYGTTERLADRGLVEIIESSPKRFRAVELDTAREQLRRRLEEQHERAFDQLETIQDERADHADERHVSTIRGHQPIYDRITDLVRTADRQVVLVGATREFVEEELTTVLQEQGEAGVFVMLVTEDEPLAQRFEDDPVHVLASPSDASDGYAGRTLLVDDATVLLSVPTEQTHDEPFDEVALWTAETRIGEILARFVHAGMEHGLDEEYPASPPS